MSVFSAGIVWDPREPLPYEYTEAALATVQPVAVGHTVRTLQDATQAVSLRRTFPSNVVKESDRNVLPAVSVSIEARITGDVAEVIARQLFWNDADAPIRQGSYTFALPIGCTVTDFTCRIGNGKVLKATARPKGEAQEAFQRAVASNATAALLDQNTPEIFTSSLGNIPPNTRIKTEITYATILKRSFNVNTNTTTLTIPTYIVNRYGQRPAGLEGLDLDTKLDDISLRIEILESEHIKSIKSASHGILVERGSEIGQAFKWDHIGKGPNDAKHETAIVTMKEASSWIETDFVLSIDTACSKGSGGAEAWLEMHPSFENHAAMMVTLPPRVLLSQNEISKDGEILFVADRSGSMEDKMVNLRSAMRFFLKGIPVGRAFNIWCFGSNYESLWAKSRVYGQESLQMALDYVDTKFHADMRGTEILAVIQAILAARDPSQPCDVVILTDGEVWRLDETLSLVRGAHESSNGAIRFFSLGLGAHVSHALVEGIAKQGGGYSEVIAEADKGGWEERVVAMLKAASSSHTCSLRLELGDLKAMASPANLESLNLFQAHRIFLLLEQGTTLEKDTIVLTLVHDRKRTPIYASVIRAEKLGTLIHSLSARAILDDLERGKVSNKTDGEELDILHLAEHIACKYSLPSKWTSLFLLAKEPEGEGLSSTTNKIVISRIEDRTLHKPRGMKTGRMLEHHSHLSSLPSLSSLPATSKLGTEGEFTSHLLFRLRGRRAKRASVVYCLEPMTPTRRVPDCEKLGAEEEFISFILSHQAFDGSIASGVLNGLPETARDIISFLKDLLCKKTNLQDPVLDLVTHTALIVELLERDYKDYKGLWVMIREKALEYIHLQVLQSNLEDELLEYARESLKQLGRPFRLQRRAASSIPTRKSQKEQLYVDAEDWWARLKRRAASLIPTGKSQKKQLWINAEDEDPADSNRVLVHQAPVG